MSQVDLSEYFDEDQPEPNINYRYPNPFKLPAATPASAPYHNLIGSTQFERNNFQPAKRKFKRVPSAQENDAALRRVLKDFWGHDDFRGPQLEICRSVMGGCDVLVVAPTGLGKSVCFQVPAVALEWGVTIVVSPLLALMKDQVAELKKKGIAAAMMYEKNTQEERKYIDQQLKMGHPEIRLLYVTPETLFGARCANCIANAYRQKQIRRLVVDEAHVIEEWGMTFRSAYRDLGRFRLEFPGVPVTALTASATEEVRQDILNLLRMPKKDLAQWVEPFNRKNLFYEIRYQSGAFRPEDKMANIFQFIQHYRPEAMKRNKSKKINTSSVSGLVYCRSRATCEDVAAGLRKQGIQAQAFHAKLDDARRDSLLRDWKTGLIECIVATIAFGMGVDQAHVRYVIHFDMPKSFEGYYQETGRAGRDGHTSRCIMYYSREDAKRLRGLIEMESKRDSAKFRKNKDGTDATAGEADQIEQQLNKARVRGLNSYKFLQQFAEAGTTCRHIAICRYFGEQIDSADADIKLAYCDKMCDVCSNPGAVARRAQVISEGIEVASQIIRAPPKERETEVDLSPIRSDDENSLPNSLEDLHGKPPPSSDPIRASSDLTDSRGVAQVHGSLVRGTITPQPSLVAPSSSKPIVAAGNSSLVSYGSTSPDHLSPAQNTRSKRGRPEDMPQRRGESSRFASKKFAIPSTVRRRRVHTPEPAREIPEINGRPGRLALAPVMNRNARPRKSFTTDVFTADNGRSTEIVIPPIDPESKQRQQEAFKAVTPITGRGPYSYYTNTAPPTMGRKRKLSTVQENGLGFRTPFVKEPVRMRVGLISKEVRSAAITAIREALKKALLEGTHADRLWTAWFEGQYREDRKRLVKAASVELEAALVKDCEDAQELGALCDHLKQTIRILRSAQGVELVASNGLEDYAEDEHGRMLILVDRVMRDIH